MFPSYAKSAWDLAAGLTRRSGFAARGMIHCAAGGSARKGVRLEDEPGLRLPDDDDETRALWKSRWEQFLRNRAVLRTDRVENTGVARSVKTAIDWLERRGKESDPFVLWLDLFAPHGPWDPPEPYRDQYVTVEPDEFEAGEEGDLIDDGSDDDADEDRDRRRRRA